MWTMPTERTQPLNGPELAELEAMLVERGVCPTAGAARVSVAMLTEDRALGWWDALHSIPAAAPAAAG
jgi:hypothetical protein